MLCLKENGLFFLEMFWNLSFSMKSISSSKFLIIWWIQEKPLSMFCWKSIWINKVLKLAKKTKKTNKTLQTPTKRKANQAETRFSAFHWITVCFFGEILTLILPKFCIFSDNLSHHMLHQNEIWETFPLWEDCFKRWLSF